MSARRDINDSLRNAEFQSAVSQVSNLRSLEIFSNPDLLPTPSRLKCGDTADSESALQLRAPGAAEDDSSDSNDDKH